MMSGIGIIKIDMNWHKYILLFTIIDSLFLPYFPLMSVSFSVLTVALWIMFNLKSVFKGKEGTGVFFVIMMMLISTLLNPLYTGNVVVQTSFSTAIKRFIQYSISLCLLLYYKRSFSQSKVDINKILFFFVIYVFGFAVLYFLFPYQYAVLKLAISPVDNHTRRYLLGTVTYRFNYLWTDPNNIAYAISGVETYLLMKGKLNIIKKYIVVGCSAFIVVASSSAGGIISFVLANALLLMYMIIFKSNYCIRAKASSLMVAILSIIAIFFVIIRADVTSNVIEPMLTKFQNRMTSYQTGANITGGRWDDLKGAIVMLNPLMLVIGSGQEGFTTEIGHIYIIGMYGFLAYISIMKLIFGKINNQKTWDYVWILPFFIGFTMNIGIGEYKWLAILILLLSYCRYGEEKADLPC